MASISEVATSTYTSNGAINAADKAPTSTGADFDTYLALLTAQMKNQDPLEPLDSTDFVAQLATFSAVEQQVHTNDLLAEMINQLSDSPTSMMAEWVGKEVRHQGEASFNGTAIDVGPAVHPYADAAVLSVRDSSGQLIYQRPFEPTQATLEWNGETTDGPDAPEGRYSFEVESYQDGSLIAAQAAPVFDLVTEVRMNNGSPVLMFADGTTMLMEEATSMRLPQV